MLCSDWIYPKKSQVQFEADAPTVAYQQHDQNSCCMISLASFLNDSNKLFSVNAIPTFIYAFLIDGVHEIPDRIKISNSIMLDQARKFGEKHLNYKLEK